VVAGKPRRASTSLAKPGKEARAETGLDTVSEPVELAKLTLQAICRNSEAPAAARAQAARTLLELSGALRVTPSDERFGAEMTLSEIDARLEALGGGGEGQTR